MRARESLASYTNFEAFKAYSRQSLKNPGASDADADTTYRM